MSSQPVRFVLIDDDRETRQLLHAFARYEPGVLLVGESATGDGAVGLVTEHQPDVLVLDLSLPDRDGLEVIREVREACPRARIVVCSGAGHRQEEAMEAGAHAWVTKSSPIQDLLAAIRG